MAKTVIHKDLDSYFGEDFHLEASQTRSFTSMVFELLVERKPTSEEVKMLDLILNLSIDHGPDTPSAVKLIEAAKSGKTLSESLAEGILAINERHGGAIEPAMNFFYRIQKNQLDAEGIRDLVNEHLSEHKIIGGYGHRIYKDADPRTTLIYERLVDLGFGEEFIEIAKKVEKEIERQKGVKLPVNIDGAIATVLCTFDWEPKLGNCVFIVARIPGLCGQFLNNT